MIKTVIFDMDGVIVDTEPVHYYAYHQHFKKLNIEVTDDLYETFTGNSTKNVFQKLKARSWETKFSFPPPPPPHFLQLSSPSTSISRASC